MGGRLAVLVDGRWDADKLESSTGRAGPDVGGSRVALDLALATAIAGSHHCKVSVFPVLHLVDVCMSVGVGVGVVEGGSLPLSRLCRLCSSTKT